ncbi:MAG: TIGR03013 family XrtA/PEP-CTERM system glycosyltransferase [Thiohalomonadaceae bacterium]
MRPLRVLGHRVSIPLLLLSLLEAVAAGVAVYAAIAFDAFGAVADSAPLSIPVFAAMSLMVLMSALGLYQLNLRATFVGIVVRTAIAFMAALPLIGTLYIIIPVEPPSMQAVAASAMVAFITIALLHAVFFTCADAGLLKRRILVLGGGPGTQALAALRRSADRRGFELVGHVPLDGEAGPGPSFIADRPLAEIARSVGADEIVVSVADRRGRLPLEALMDCRYAGIGVVEMIDFIEREAGKVRVDLLRPGWMLFNTGETGRPGVFAKRALDLVAGLLLLMVGLPFMMATALAVKIEDGWRAPVLYRQRRVGQGGTLFELVKFRSMRVDAEADGRPRFAATDDDRVTRVGRIIRKVRIDELPQLFNVIRGDMSLVGPRPERPEFVAKLECEIPFYRERHRIKPGITGWAQLLYPYGATQQDMLEKTQYDLYYLKNRGLLLDLIILLQTVEVVVFGKGAR